MKIFEIFGILKILSSAWVKNHQIPLVNFEATRVNSSSIFVLFFTAMTHNSSVNFKLVHFQL